MVRPGRPLPRDAALVILPGSKATIADLAFLRREGWDIDILAHRRQGGHILGLCGGYQMLGRSIADPLGMEGRRDRRSPGLGLLDIETVLGGAKAPRPRLPASSSRPECRCAATRCISGRRPGRASRARCCAWPAARMAASAPTGWSPAATCTGCLPAIPFRRAFLAGLGRRARRHRLRAPDRDHPRRARRSSRAAVSILPALLAAARPPRAQASSVTCAASQAPSNEPAFDQAGEAVEAAAPGAMSAGAARAVPSPSHGSATTPSA